jgi:mannan endo-1,4-beta-mannosidase
MGKRHWIAAALAGVLVVPLWAANVASAATPPGLHISGGRLVEADGTAFVMRGVNHAHTWYTGQTQSYADMSELGANAVRTVLSSGDRWTKNTLSDVENVVQLAKDAEMISILEVHDTTGYGEDGAAVTLSKAVDYWISIKDALVGQEDYVLLNIGNEPYGNSGYSTYAQDNTQAISRLRAAGIRNAIVVDAPNWGQDWSGTMRDNARAIFDSDPDGNVLFSVHMYGVYDTAQEIKDYMSAFQSAGLPLIVGEFGNKHSDGDVDEDTILSEAQARGIGWLGWSWSGNSGGVEYLDLTNGFNPDSLTTWGQRLFNGANGIAATSVRAGIFDDGPDPTDTTPPTAPGPPTVSSVTSSGATVSWTASTDNVKVTGYTVQDASTGAALATATGTTATLSGLSAETAYSVQVVARDAAGNVSTASGSAAFTTASGPAPGSCTATLSVDNSWPGGYQAEVKVVAGTSALTGWQVSLTLPSGSSIANLWGGANTGTSGSVTVANAQWNGALGSNQSTSFGFVGTGSAPTAGSLPCAAG